jgi:hypothetical protein
MNKCSILKVTNEKQLQKIMLSCEITEKFTYCITLTQTD